MDTAHHGHGSLLPDHCVNANPVTFAPAREREEATPVLTGSALTVMMGIPRVASTAAARVAAALTAKMTSTRFRLKGSPT